MNILVIGGTGFIGQWVVRRLVEEGHTVSLLHRGETELDLPSSVYRIKSNRSRLPEISGELRHLDLQVVIDIIAYTEADAHLLVDTFNGLAERIVVLSSMDVYHDYGAFLGKEENSAPVGAATEDSPLRTTLYPYRDSETKPDTLLYDYEKILVERVVMASPGLAGTVLRLPCVYGPGDEQRRTFDYLRRMDDGRPAVLLSRAQSRWKWTRGYVENIAAAIVLAATDDRASGRIYNVGEEEPLTEARWIESIGKAAGGECKVEIIDDDLLPNHLKQPVQWEFHLISDTRRIRKELGYREPISPREAMKTTIEWERAHPPAAVDPARFDYAAEDAALQAQKLRSSHSG